MFNSAYEKILRITGRGRFSPNNNKESEYERESVELYIGGRLVKKDKYLIRNGAYVFKELVKSNHGKITSFRIFSLKELQKATNNFSADLILNDSYSRTYRGIFEDRHIAVKIPTGLPHTFEDEVVSLSLINHKNVVKLLGCCIETENLIVILELPLIGTLEQNIFHEKPLPVELLWTDRLRIAIEIADALAYLHLALHITHGCLWDAKAVLLDEFHSAKLGAFDYSEIQKQVKSSDAETDIRNKVKKREDAYHFGNILLNLLGIDFGILFDECYDKAEILKYLKLNVSTKEMPQIEAYIDLIGNIFVVNQQPSMKEVVRELRRIRSLINHQPTTDGNESGNLSSGANASSNNASTSYISGNNNVHQISPNKTHKDSFQDEDSTHLMNH